MSIFTSNRLSEFEVEALNFGVVMLDPCSVLYSRVDGRHWGKTEKTSLGITNLDNLVLRQDDKDFAYIEQIKIEKHNDRIVIGHFGIEPKYKGTGLAIRIIKKFAAELKVIYGINYILFAENSTKPEYPIFFTNKLNAVPLTYESATAWLWEIK
ncbi:hypothetical protein [Colwellia sp. UCD-KL20]|uniref:hypothetical protein n=1 Tax=Colwellia sp. UCD-KL20 TaxID=1917165 RepID=UPI00097060F7|nr:hypothetical protein [Colwellia sp. UCD-KL20]